MEEDTVLIEQMYKKYILGRPHVVILGAGATIAAIPKGDKFGKRCSVMNNFIENLGLRDLFNKVELKTSSQNLEDIYSELYTRPECANLRIELEQRIINSFSEFVIPDEPTTYDYLLLSLRSKDFIFSFNWDDLIIQAYQRAYRISNDLPQLVFLHGNINLGMCQSCGAIESLQNRTCRKCGGELNRPKILFPVKEKNYGEDPYIEIVWDAFLDILSEATIVTIFGYSAPQSDALAINAMQKAFSSKFRRLDQIEIIDIAPENDLRKTWENFIEPTNYHCRVCKTIFDSLLSEFPRRTIEGYWKRYISGWWGSSKIQFTPNMTFSELENRLNPLINDELSGKFVVK